MNHFSQKLFGESLGVSRVVIGLVEQRRNDPSENLLKKIERVYNINPKWLRKGVLPHSNWKKSPGWMRQNGLLEFAPRELFQQFSDSYPTSPVKLKPIPHSNWKKSPGWDRKRISLLRKFITLRRLFTKAAFLFCRSELSIWVRDHNLVNKAASVAFLQA